MNSASEDLLLQPFDPKFDPLARSLKQSHFQFSFLFVWNRLRRQALNDFYAFCRLVDDLADEEYLAYPRRKAALEEIRKWINESFETGSVHPYWNRLSEELQNLNTSPDILRGILQGVQMDMRPQASDPIRFETWDDLNRYVQGVAGDVGKGVLSILGARGGSASFYSEQLGRCVQYLNIMRDLEEDAEENRIYIPQEFLRKHGLSLEKASDRQQIRDELYDRALQHRAEVSAFSWRCFPAELMVFIYLEASKHFWRKGRKKKLSTRRKLKASMKALRSIRRQGS